MPWTAPKTLTTEEVYAVTAFLLNLNGIVPDDYTLSNKNIAEVQARMPNRNGMTTAHSMWPGPEFKGTKKPDTSNIACMKNCAPEPKLASFLPEFARNAHGNLAEQSRMVGAQHGADTTRPEVKAGGVPPPAAETQAKPPETKAPSENKAVVALLNKNNCLACHGLDKKIIGPAFADVAKKNAGNTEYLAKKIKAGSSGVWGAIPMPPQSLNEADTKTIANWLANGAGK